MTTRPPGASPSIVSADPVKARTSIGRPAMVPGAPARYWSTFSLSVIRLMAMNSALIGCTVEGARPPVGHRMSRGGGPKGSAPVTTVWQHARGLEEEVSMARLDGNDAI